MKLTLGPAAQRGRRQRLPGLPWPLPAVLAWGGGFAAWWALLWLGAGTTAAWWGGCAVSLAAAAACRGLWRQLLAAVGFPLALLLWPGPRLAAQGAPVDGVAAVVGSAAALPPLAWAAAALLLLLLYPLGAWRDAPWFPTPRGALAGLAQACAAYPPAAVLDAGCGTGDGLRELRLQFPTAAVHGVERSRALRWLAARRCRWAQVRAGDLWAEDWSRYGLVYVFQRPESMARAHAKAMRELPVGGWLASLEFEVPGVAATQRLAGAQGRPVWLYLKRSTSQPGCR
jgi:hypothetical protein